jgi:hypothetical protein
MRVQPSEIQPREKRGSGPSGAGSGRTKVAGGGKVVGGEKGIEVLMVNSL